MHMYVFILVYLYVDVCIYIVISKFWFHPEFVMVGFWEGRWVEGGGVHHCGFNVCFLNYFFNKII
jgi:hypothetical protein